jgi:hypothetical protein
VVTLLAGLLLDDDQEAYLADDARAPTPAADVRDCVARAGPTSTAAR